ncbi:cytidine deaminase [Streptomyces sp. SCSIO 30461]|uniref:cytidine deaminase n=1 Tax=Streptomyces sp. SCSIO 30461 TaxID=3118085 RepID=UPI0030D18ED9
MTSASAQGPGAGSHGVDGHVAESRDAADAFDWEALRELARDVMSRAYAPYSGFPVGAAARVDDGRTVVGCNVENASYGLGLCAECGLVSQLQTTGGGRLTHFTCVDGNGDVLMPCGRCRQLLYEFGGPGLLLETATGVLTLAEMLPLAFGPEQLGPGKLG